MCSIDVLLNSIFITSVQHRHLGFSVRFNQSSFLRVIKVLIWTIWFIDISHGFRFHLIFAMEGVGASPLRPPKASQTLFRSAGVKNHSQSCLPNVMEISDKGLHKFGYGTLSRISIGTDLATTKD
jgi:hypothetical protein